jgi:glyoxylase-like metal-dependent hydrolase (beta-lactamase superfamily II)
MSPIAHYRDDSVEVRKACVGSWENNVYVVACRRTGRSVIVDAASEPDTIERLVAGTTPLAILTTHGHLDHVGAARVLAERFSIPLRMDPGDVAIAGLDPDEPIGSDPISVGDAEIVPIPTPGHTPGSTCFTVGGVVLTGDTLFPGGPGAATGPGSSFDEIILSIETSLFTLGDETLVLPGHGLDTTIGSERPQLASWVERRW